MSADPDPVKTGAASVANKKQKIQITTLNEERGLLMGGRFTPKFDQPLPHLSRPGMEAVAVSDIHGNDEEFFCLLCDADVFIRHEVLTELAERTPRRIRLPHAAATVRRTNGTHYFAIVFDNARARPLAQYYQGGLVPEKDLTSHILPSIINCLTDLNTRSICHRGIRPENILISEGGNAILDQCVTGLPGEAQPAAYEPQPSMMATPGGRGDGLPADDHYALGVTALELATGEVPGGETAAEDLHLQKILRGSYYILLQRRKFSSALQALLSGTLSDFSKQRWDIEDLRAWAGGHWDMARPSAGGRRAARPLAFAGGDIYCPDILAWAFHRNPEEAAECILSHRAERWLRNVLEDNQAADAMEDARKVYHLNEAADNADIHELIARACFALDAKGPLRFRSIVVAPSGLAGLLWTAFQTKDETLLEDLHLFFASQLFLVWQSTGDWRIRAALPTYYVSLFRSIMIEHEKPGFGLSRIYYELLPGAPCLEDNVKAMIPVTAGDVIVALDRLAAKEPERCLDVGSHIGGFVLSKDKTSETTVRALSLNYSTETERMIAVGDLFAYLQRNHFELPLHQLTNAIATSLVPALDDIKSRLRRVVVQQKIETLSEPGDITTLIRDLDLKQTLRQDAFEMELARERLEAVDRLIAISGSNGQAQTVVAQKRGYRYARLFSMSVSFLTIFYFSMIELL